MDQHQDRPRAAPPGWQRPASRSRFRAATDRLQAAEAKSSAPRQSAALPKKSLISRTWNAPTFVLNFCLPTLEQKYEATRRDLDLLQPLVNGLLGASCKMNP